MVHVSNENSFEVKESEETFSEWLNKPYISEDLKQNLKNTNVLIIPIEGARDYEGPVFPSGTGELLNFLRENSQDTMRPDICIENEDYVELIEHWDLYVIGFFLASQLVAPLLVNLLYDYIKMRIGPRLFKTKVRVGLTIENNGTSIKLDYEGPAEEFRDTLIPAIDQISKK